MIFVSIGAYSYLQVLGREDRTNFVPSDYQTI